MACMDSDGQRQKCVTFLPPDSEGFLSSSVDTGAGKRSRSITYFDEGQQLPSYIRTAWDKVRPPSLPPAENTTGVTSPAHLPPFATPTRGSKTPNMRQMKADACHRTEQRGTDSSSPRASNRQAFEQDIQRKKRTHKEDADDMTAQRSPRRRCLECTYISLPTSNRKDASSSTTASPAPRKVECTPVDGQGQVAETGIQEGSSASNTDVSSQFLSHPSTTVTDTGSQSYHSMNTGTTRHPADEASHLSDAAQKRVPLRRISCAAKEIAQMLRG
ncbi:UNVERIFIED_CONTAM: hypothetical protein HHA_453410 [Hammondia hammondi]|eukprot:XP_008886732.1 hypothetical protein HHA_453410 [Hammondia hammondi]